MATIAENLQEIINIKHSIKDSINAKGGSVLDTTPFGEYSTAITNLPSGGGGDEALKGLIERSATNLNIPNGTTKIGDDAFYQYSGLTSVNIPNSVTDIGKRAFCRCSGLTSVNIPDNGISIGDNAFENCKVLSSITIPDSVVNIGGSAFRDCDSLTSIRFNHKINDKNYIFSSCDNLEEIHFDEGITQFGCSYMFYSCKNLQNIYCHSLPFNVICGSGYNGMFSSVGQNGVVHCPSGLTNSFKNILSSGSSSLQSQGWTVVDDLSPISIDYNYEINATYNITKTGSTRIFNQNLASANFPQFGYVEEDDIYWRINGNYRIFNELKEYTFHFYYDDINTINWDEYFRGSAISTIAIPEGFTQSPYRMFYQCSGLTNVTIPSTMVEVGNSIFAESSGFTSVGVKGSGASVEIPENVTTIGEYAFHSTTISSVTLPDSITSIGYSSFYGCPNLTDVTIPSSVTSIGSQAFAYSSNLTNVTINSKVASLSGAPFQSVKSTGTLTCYESWYNAHRNDLYMFSKWTKVWLDEDIDDGEDGGIFENW